MESANVQPLIAVVLTPGLFATSSLGKSFLFILAVPQYVSSSSRSSAGLAVEKKLSKKTWWYLLENSELNREQHDNISFVPACHLVFSLCKFGSLTNKAARRFGANPHFYPTLNWLHWHILFHSQPSLKLYHCFVHRQIFLRSQFHFTTLNDAIENELNFE